jgi:polyisoprenyl-phosphate glycosyltransferase
MEVNNIDFSVIIPAYNEAGNLSPLVKRIKEVMAEVKGGYEIVIVDNGSFDSSPFVLNDLLRNHNSLVVLTLSRNFGCDGAIMAGLENARGERLIIMDGDQQDPPEEIPRFISKMDEGYDIVYGVRKKRTEGLFIRIMMKFFYHIWQKVSEIEVPKDAGNFGIISKDVLNIIKGMPERNKFFRGLRAWTGYPAVGLVYKRVKRPIGESKFSFISYFNAALNGITSFSIIPIRIFSYVGFFGITLCIAIGLFMFITRLAQVLGFSILPYTIPMGGTTTALLVIVCICIVFIGFGIVGEYVGAILKEVKHRPDFIIRNISRSSEKHHTD